jgi:hypothetical protein
MQRLLSQKQAINIMIALLNAVLVFHTLVLTAVIPYAIVWAGKVSSVEEMKKLEVVSICINAFAILVFVLKAGYIQHKIPAKILNGFILLLAVLFSLNTIENFFAKSKFEFYFFTPLTFILAVLCLRIVTDKRLK